ncbi:DNA-3-methyladenine glycosylase II [Deinobacterium chartae]|uniref:DNA-3-methyladenine glycosylase II n=1 Tax=Deinobacterium chartae TaxID=521158 RepID=A0A841I523_9DEIO|nr:DNA-3-methyladenine glycosylase 2 family protein [Deinobacterium chartae]MBB6099530.1 DNA-3-methyladenine glycosylase II [Deinobacterium chartae]
MSETVISDAFLAASLEAALTHLRRDPVLAALIEQHGPLAWPSRGTDPFETLARSVIGQQLSVRAADTIEARVRAGLGSLSPQAFAAAAPEALRGYGLSWAKVRTLQALSAAVLEGRLPIHDLHALEDEQIIAHLVVLPGIGRWTAEMFLIFGLGRPDVFSPGDAGLRKALQVLYGPQADPDRVVAAWSPYRSLACLYLWRSLNNVPVSAT